MSQDRREITEGRYPQNMTTIRRQLHHRYMYIFNLCREAYTSEIGSALDYSQKLMSAYVLYKIDFQTIFG